MKFLLDVCAASRTLYKTLTDAGHDVLSASEGYTDAPDEELLAMAYEQERVLVTKDKDFGKLIFLRHLPHPCVIRFAALSVTEQAKAMLDLIENESDAIRNRAIIVVTTGRIRVRIASTVEYDND